VKRFLLAIDVGNLPDKFKIFRKGANPSTKGTVFFDSIDAVNVMAAFEKHGVDLMIDLEHQSLDGSNPDAVGWCRLAVIDGDLWAVDVKWNDEGTARLTAKKQRYISPAFYTDKDDHVTELINIALCAMPATEKAMPLVAASRSVKMEEFLKKLAATLKLSEGATEEEILAALAKLAAPPEEIDEEAPAPVEESALAALTREVVSLSARLAKQEKDQTADRVNVLVDSNLDKIPPALEAWARSQSFETLTAFVASAPAIHARSATPPTREKVVALTAVELAAAKNLNMTVEQYTKAKGAANG
jgi:phage I-like protein